MTIIIIRISHLHLKCPRMAQGAEGAEAALPPPPEGDDELRGILNSTDDF